MDDFFGVTDTQTTALRNKSTFLHVCKILGIPVSPEKIQLGQKVEYLGLCIDTVEWTISFSEKKWNKLKAKLTLWLSLKSITRKKLQKYIGTFVHASIVYFGGGTFTRPLIHKLKNIPEKVNVNMERYPEILLSLKWWDKALSNIGKRAITEHIKQPKHLVWSDASSKQGLACFHNKQWYAIAWKHWKPWYFNVNSHEDIHINILELLAIVCGCSIWGGTWKASVVLFYCDNTSVCEVIATRRSKDEIMNHLLMILHYIQIHFSFEIRIEYIKTDDNIDADDLSRQRFKRFFIRHPTADKVGQKVKWSILPDFQLDTTFLNFPKNDQDSIAVNYD
jgi:hypothetical protein